MLPLFKNVNFVKKKKFPGMWWGSKALVVSCSKQSVS